MLGKEDGLFGKAISGSPEVIASALRGLAQAGVAHVQVVLHPLRLAAVEAFAQIVELLN